MRSQYPTKTVHDVLVLQYGKPLPESERIPEGGVPAYGANGALCRSKQPFRTKPSIIVGRKGSAGEVNLTEGPFWPTDVTYFVEHDEQASDLQYLFYALKLLNLQKLARGVKPGLNRNEVYALKIPVPSLFEQKRIVTILNEAFEGIGAAVANAEKSLTNARDLFESYLNCLFTNRGQNWITEPLGANVRFIDYRGKTPPKREAGIRLITAKNVKMGFIQHTPEEFVDPLAYAAWMTRGFPKKDDVLFTTEAPLGNVAQLDTDETVIIGQRLITFQPNSQVLDRTFLKFTLMSQPIQQEIFKRRTGATVSGIKASLLKQVPIHFPKNVAEQIALAAKIGEMSEACQRGRIYLPPKG